MTQPQQSLAVMAIPAMAPDGQHIVQLRIVVGVSAFILELPTDAAEQFGEQTHTALARAVETVRRANIGVPGLIVPNSARP